MIDELCSGTVRGHEYLNTLAVEMKEQRSCNVCGSVGACFAKGQDCFIAPTQIVHPPSCRVLVFQSSGVCKGQASGKVTFFEY